MGAAIRLVALGDLDLAGEHDDQTVASLAHLGERLAGSKGADLAEAAHPLELRVLQHWKHLGPAGLDGRLRGGHRSLTTACC